jgi:aldehyde dehydrogenase (NAD+)
MLRETPAQYDLAGEVARILRGLGVADPSFSSGSLAVRSPIDGSLLGTVREASAEEVSGAVGQAQDAFLAWRDVPAPQRGEVVRRLGGELRENKASIARLITLETGKIASEALGEVQEMIDICDFATGLSRQLYGKTIASERRGHALRELWHPLGAVAAITAFNFPGAVWSWNTALALTCGNSVVWKPSEKTPLTALAADALFRKAGAGIAGTPAGIHQVVIGGHEVVTPSADPGLAVRAVLFAAVGTAGQRCTTLRRLFVHDAAYGRLLPLLKSAYASVAIGSPLDSGTLMGPLIDQAAFDGMQAAIKRARNDGGEVTGGNRVLADRFPGGYYTRPALIEMPRQTQVVQTETFAPILYVMRYEDLDEAIALNNCVPQGLSSAIMTTDLREAELFMSARGSDCGIVNINMGPSGAEIGGAFGGEKETGGGRESGSDSWKAYMRRTTNTINYSEELPLAQGVRFDIPVTR